MDLFSSIENDNILPYDGITTYHGMIMREAEAAAYARNLLQNIAWRNDEAVIFGKHIITRRKVAWYGDRPYAYSYSNISRQALPWTTELLQLKAMTEAVAGTTFNSCLLNLYHDGSEGMSWHSDDERELARNSTIASLSLGAERRFCFRHKQSKQVININLPPGSLLLMKGGTQTHWLHSLPKAARVKTPRINLTFRTMNDTR